MMTVIRRGWGERKSRTVSQQCTSFSSVTHCGTVWGTYWFLDKKQERKNEDKN
jgi:hypothetical protein